VFQIEYLESCNNETGIDSFRSTDCTKFIPAPVKAKLMPSIEATLTADLVIAVRGSFVPVLMFTANPSHSTGVTGVSDIVDAAVS